MVIYHIIRLILKYLYIVSHKFTFNVHRLMNNNLEPTIFCTMPPPEYWLPNTIGDVLLPCVG